MELLPSFLKFEKLEDNQNKPLDQERAIEPLNDDGSFVIESAGTSINAYYDPYALVKPQENELIRTYRRIAETSEVDSAIQDIINEAVNPSDGTNVVELIPDNVDGLSETIKKKLVDEFQYIHTLLNFNNDGPELFRKWYVDGRQHFQKIVDEKNMKKGIIKIKYIDPLKIQKVKEVEYDKTPEGAKILRDVKEYFVYNNDTEKGVNAQIELPLESVAYAHSGIVRHYDTGQNAVSEKSSMVLSFLDKAIKPFNQLTDLEDHVVIHRLARSAEKRVFYIDIGNLPKTKAEEYMSSIINKYKNKIVYDTKSGSVKDSRHLATMMEDIWLPRKEGTRGTEVSTLQSTAQGFDNIEDVLYFRKKLYKALNIPISRLEAEGSINFGRGGEITRDELKFSKFVKSLRTRYSAIFTDLMGTQVVLKNIMTREEWDRIKNDLIYQFQEDSYFKELAELEVFGQRMQILSDFQDALDKYYSHEWVRKNILKQTDEEITEQDKIIGEEKKNPQFNPPEDEQQNGYNRYN